METLRLRGAGVPLSGGGRLFGVTAEALAILALVPLAAAVVGSLGVVGPTGGYVYWWGTARGWESLARTMAVAAPAGAMAVLMAWVLVASAVHLSPRWAVGIVMAACLPLLVPSSLLATTWIVALGREGLITRAIARSSSTRSPARPP
jgi:ABC-type Fe3+ transport system permease subunit